MLIMNRDKNLMKYGFVSVILLASFLMTVPANQYQKIFAQTEDKTPTDTKGNVTDENQENATDVEIPTFDGVNATFVPRPEDERVAPPVPADAIKGAELPHETPPKDPDSVPLSITNRTEILDVLPANSTKIIEHVNDDLKNSTGEGLLPPAILDKIISGKGQGNGTILDMASPEELKEIKNFSESTTNQTAEQALDEGEPISISNVTNATSGEQAKTGEEQAQTGGEATNATNATSGESPSQSREQAKQTEGEKEQAKTGAEEQALAGTPEVTNMTNATNATSGESPSQSREKAKQTEDEKEQAKTGAEEQALAGTPEVTNMTNATSGDQPSQKEQKQAGGEETTTIIGKQKQTGGEETTTIIGKQKQTKGGEEQSLNTTNVTSMLNATDSKDGNDNPEDGG